MNNSMNQEVFVRIIKALQEQKKREEKFSEAIQQAFTDAGELAEFHTADNFTPPTNVMVDQILEALSYGFVGENQTQEEAYDHINYFFYELEMVDYQFAEPVSEENTSNTHTGSTYYANDGRKLPLATPEDLYNSIVYNVTDNCPEEPKEIHVVPAYYRSKDGKKLPLATPEDLYNSLVYEMTAKRPVESKNMPVEDDPMMNNAIFVEMYNRIVKIIDDKLGLSENTKIHIAPTNDICHDFGIYSADSLDYVEILMAIEKEFDHVILDDDFDEIKTNPTPLAITKWIVNKIGFVSKS